MSLRLLPRELVSTQSPLIPEVFGPSRAGLAHAQERMEALAGARFNSCLLNLYRDGRDAMGWHSDNESLYGPAPTIGAPAAALPRDTHRIAVSSCLCNSLIAASYQSCLFCKFYQSMSLD